MPSSWTAFPIPITEAGLTGGKIGVLVAEGEAPAVGLWLVVGLGGAGEEARGVEFPQEETRILTRLITRIIAQRVGNVVFDV
jgi:hypothetical protein